MIVYADRYERVRTVALFEAIRRSYNVTEKLILFGQLESGVVDELSQNTDSSGPLTAALRRIAIERTYDDVSIDELPDEINIRLPEGYAFYSLYPENYARAALRFYADHSPDACVVVGIRSIGTSLSAVVASALQQHGCHVWSFTVRPQGHPFERELGISSWLRAEIVTHASRGEYFLVVDEGPGLSGSSFTAVAETLSSCGVPDNRIVFFPSHDPDPSAFRSQRARVRWPCHSRYVELFREEDHVPAGAQDVSGGQWRRLLFRAESEWPAVQPQHERRKYLSGREHWKFAGIANIGSARLERAHVLRKFTPAVLQFSDGFLVSEFVDGRPLTNADTCDALLDTMARYLAEIRSTFVTERPVAYSALVEMIRINTGVECPHHNNVVEEGTIVCVDGRMLPHEWIWAGNRFIKTDAVDHHDDHFFPGCQDIAWDLAGAILEFDMTERDAEHLIAKYLQLRTDSTLRQRMPFYKLAYLAYRIGYVSMAEESLAGTEDGQRFALLRARYTMALDRA